MKMKLLKRSKIVARVTWKMTLNKINKIMLASKKKIAMQVSRINNKEMNLNMILIIKKKINKMTQIRMIMKPNHHFHHLNQKEIPLQKISLASLTIMNKIV